MSGKSNQLKAGVIFSYLELAIQIMVSFFVLPVLIRALGKEEYGLYGYIASVVSYLNILKAGLGTAYVRFYTRASLEEDAEKKTSSVNATYFLVVACISILALIGGGLIYAFRTAIFGGMITPLQAKSVGTLIIIITITVICNFFSGIFSSYIVAQEKFILRKTITLAEVILRPFVVLPLAFAGFGAVGYASGILIVFFFVTVVEVFYCIRKLRFKMDFSNLDFKLFKEILTFTSYMVIIVIVDQINWSVDKYLLGKMKGVIAVTIYQLAAQLRTYTSTMVTAVTNVFIVRVNRLVAKHADPSVLTALVTRVGRIQFMVLALISGCFAVFGKYFLQIWVGTGYDDTYYIFLILLVPFIIPGIQLTCAEVLKAKNMNAFRSFVYAGISVLNICISIPLCKRYAGIGCAIGTALSLIIGNGIIMNIYYHKRVGLNMIRFWKSILTLIPSQILPIGVLLLVAKFIEQRSVLTFIGGIILYLAVYAVSVWFLGLNQDEKNQISNLFTGFRRRFANKKV